MALTNPARTMVVLALQVLAPLLWCRAQTAEPAHEESPVMSIRRFEIGGQMTDLRLSTCFGAVRCPTPQLGLGPGAAVNLHRDLAIEGELNVLPRVDNYPSDFVDGSVAGGRATEFLAGVRAEKRARHYGYFLDAKPGLVSWSKALTGFEVSSPAGGPATETYITGRRNFFATELGGGIEYSASSRLHVRVDMGDLLVRYGNNSFCNNCVHWINNLQTTAAVYVGAGHSLSWSEPPRASREKHEFFGKSNLALMGISLLGQTADAVTTQRFISHGAKEGNPLAAPFVKYGWSGQVGLAVFTNAAEIAGMYGLHKMGAHWFERAVPLSIATASAVAAYRNQQDQ